MTKRDAPERPASRRCKITEADILADRELVEKIRRTANIVVGEPMTSEQFHAWLDEMARKARKGA